MRIFHVALREEWEAARRGRTYDRSTLGRSLAEVGFVHCSRADQWQGVRDAVYGEVSEPLVLLTIDTDLLDAPVVEEPGVPGSAETFPHVYGAVAVDAVVDVTPIRSPGAAPSTPPTPTPVGDPARGRSFASLLMAEIGVRIGLAVVVMVASVLAGTAAGAAAGEPWGLVGAVTTLVVGTVLAVAAYRRWDRRRT